MRLEAENIAVSIAGKSIVKNVTLDVPEHKFSALLGANGSGKTTLLRAIYKTQKTDSGTVRLDGEDIARFSGKKIARRMAVMGQFNQINFDYTVMDIALMGRYPFHTLLEREKDRDYEAALEALSKVGMKDYRDRNFQSLSGGEKQRVVLARALTQNPKVLILDEPTNHLDIRYRLEILSIIKDLGITVLAALHDLGLAAQYCDYLYLMRQGEIVESGVPEDYRLRTKGSELRGERRKCFGDGEQGRYRERCFGREQHRGEKQCGCKDRLSPDAQDLRCRGQGSRDELCPCAGTRALDPALDDRASD